MADIKLLIKIPEEDFKKLVNPYQHNEVWCNRLKRIVMNGTLLPKGHGTLKDVDNIKTAFPSGEYVRTESVRATIDHEDTIIEADKAESEDKE